MSESFNNEMAQKLGGDLGRRGFLLGSLAIGTTALLAGCSPSGNVVAASAGASDFAPTGNADLAISWWGATDRDTKTRALLDLYSKKNPGVKFTPTSGALTGYQQKMVTEFSAGAGKDVFQVADARPFASTGQFLDFDPYIQAKAINLTGANQSTLDAMKYKGKQYTLPWGLAAGVMFFDKKVFNDLGVPLPKPAWTWDDYRQTAKAITEASPKGFYGSADIWAPTGTGSWAPFQSFLLSRAIQPYTEAGQLNFSSNELKEWFTFWDDMRKAGYVTPAQITAEETSFPTSPIVTGKAAIYPINSSIASSLQALCKNPLGLTTEPTGWKSTTYLKGTQFGQYVNASVQIGANAKTKYPNWVVNFIDFALNDPDANKITLMSRGVPLNPAVTEVIKPLLLPIEVDMASVIAFIQANAVPNVVTMPVADGQLATLFQAAHQAIAFAKSTIDDAASSFLTQAKTALAGS